MEPQSNERRPHLGRRPERAGGQLQEQVDRRATCRSSTLRTPYSRVPGAATSRSATSRWSISVASHDRNARGEELDQPNRMGDADVVGQVAGDAQRARGASAAARSRADRSTSEQVAFDDRHVRDGRRSAARRRGRDRSRTRSPRFARAARGRVSAPRPGPISMNVSSGCGSIARTTFSTQAGSRKCWPNRFALAPGPSTWHRHLQSRHSAPSAQRSTRRRRRASTSPRSPQSLPRSDQSSGRSRE